MTTITIDRATVEQALEALEAMQSYAAAERKGLRICDEAIPALRAALAHQAEPVAGCETEADCTSQPWCRIRGECQRKQAEPVEPVAGRAFLKRILTAMGGVLDVADRKTDEFDALRSCVIDLTVMLHTAPPQRQPLTEEEIMHIGMTHQSLRQVVRAVERAHGIKE